MYDDDPDDPDDHDNKDERRYSGLRRRPVSETIKSSPAALERRRVRRQRRLRDNWGSAIERFERAAAIFLRMAVLAGTRPRRGALPHHRNMHAEAEAEAEGNPAPCAEGPALHAPPAGRANPSTVWVVSHELYGWNPPGVEHAKPALGLLHILPDKPPATTGFPQVSAALLKQGYRAAKRMAAEARTEVARHRFDLALEAACLMLALGRQPSTA